MGGWLLAIDHSEMRADVMRRLSRMLRERKGFTFVEMCAVLVVLVILAAILIPRYMKFIDDAKSETILAEARTVLISAQSAAVRFYANGEDLYSELDPLGINPDLIDTIMEMSDLESEGEILSLSYSSKNKVTDLTYTNFEYVAHYNGKKWECSKYTPPKSEKETKTATAVTYATRTAAAEAATAEVAASQTEQ